MAHTPPEANREKEKMLPDGVAMTPLSRERRIEGYYSSFPLKIRHSSALPTEGPTVRVRCGL
ncbi:MAG: hypothetical protein D6741_18790 [Planctomycetota bacterium]|nr:MAG: hypothetical protein D6741_18790 [Planctomycetota bacterium]